MIDNKEYRLTQYSHGAGCGCKIAPAVLDQILKTTHIPKKHANLVVGNTEKDDAAVINIGNGQGIISTTDFFMPIVDDAFDFGRIASVNAISDIYAMGGKPIMAIAILGWPIKEIPPHVANDVISGARAICDSIDVPLAGGHSIDSPEPIFGLAVTGKINLDGLKKNGGASKGASLYLTKGLGVGILTTAEKKGILRREHRDLAKNSMLQLNSFGSQLSKYSFVQAMTDVTGFGLGGHLSEMCAASSLSALINLSTIPVVDNAILDYIDQGCVPGGTKRNYDSYGHHLSELSNRERALICDPQTSGGLLIAIQNGFEHQFEAVAKECQQSVYRLGEMTESESKMINFTA